jgi:hypothetical protein
MGPENVLQLLLNEKSPTANHSTTTDARDKMAKYLESLEFFM